MVLLGRIPVVLLALAIGGGGRAYGVEGDCAGATAPAGEPLALARVATTAPRVNFVAGRGAKTPGCPSAESACSLKAFVVPGDAVLTIAEQGSGADGPYVCATFKSPRGAETSGWLPRAALVFPSPAPQSAKDWAGQWRRDDEAEIVLKASAARVEASGQASWGGGDPRRVRAGAVNTGEISGAGEPRGGTLAIGYADGAAPPPENGADCAARLRLFGPYLAVEDNGACGGLNVSFSGIYVRDGAP